MSNKSQLKTNNSTLQTILAVLLNKQDKTVTPGDTDQSVAAEVGSILGTVHVKAVPDSSKKGVYLWKKLTAQGGNFVDFVVSDNSSAYPDSGTQDGYWYEKISNVSKVEVGTITLTSSASSLTINHSLGEVPDIVIVYTKKSTDSSYTVGSSTVIGPYSKGELPKSVCLYLGGTSTTLYRSSYTTITEDTVTIPYVSSAKRWGAYEYSYAVIKLDGGL